MVKSVRVVLVCANRYDYIVCVGRGLINPGVEGRVQRGIVRGTPKARTCCKHFFGELIDVVTLICVCSEFFVLLI